jgi:hypothetical protein
MAEGYCLERGGNEEGTRRYKGGKAYPLMPLDVSCISIGYKNR